MSDPSKEATAAAKDIYDSFEGVECLGDIYFLPEPLTMAEMIDEHFAKLLDEREQHGTQEKDTKACSDS